MTPGFSLRRIFNRRRYMRACRDRPEPGGRMLHQLLGVEVEEHPRGDAGDARAARPERVGWHRDRGRPRYDGRTIFHRGLTRLRAATCSLTPPLGRRNVTPSDVATPGRSTALLGRRASRKRGVVLRYSGVSQRNTPTTKEDTRQLSAGPRRHVAARRAVTRAARSPL